jgi:hypothetical protein
MSFNDINIILKVKSTVVPVLYQLSNTPWIYIWGNGGIAPPYFDLGTKWK